MFREPSVQTDVSCPASGEVLHPVKVPLLLLAVICMGAMDIDLLTILCLVHTNILLISLHMKINNDVVILLRRNNQGI